MATRCCWTTCSAARPNDPLGRAAGYLDGIRSVIVGVAGNKSLAERRAVETAEFGLPLNEAAAAGVVGTDATEPVASGGARS